MSNCVNSVFTEVTAQFKTGRNITSQCIVYTSYQRKHFDFTSDRGEIIAHCRASEGIAKATGMIRAIASDKSSNTNLSKVCYVIGVEDDPVCKVGVSFDPLARLKQLQDATYKDLFLFGALVSCDRHGELLEQLTHDAGEREAKWRKGEWLGLPPERAMEIMLEQAQAKRLSVCDMGTWLDNFSNRVRAMAKAPTRRAA